MRQLEERDFEALCRAPAVRRCMASFEERRRPVARVFWTRVALGIGLSTVLLLGLLTAGWPTTGFVLFAVGLLISFILAAIPLAQAKEELKHPVLEELARIAGMEFLPHGFAPPVFEPAKDLLFGRGGFASVAFTDLFNGTDEDGRGCAVYEACLQRRGGRNSNIIVFQGQMYALQRRPGPSHWTLVMPDRKLLNFWKPASDLQRVRIDGDDAFERRFEVYAGDEAAARALLDPQLRGLLLDLRQAGRVYVYAGPEEALIAVWGKDRFEPGTMLRARPAQERVRKMFDEVRASLATLEKLKEKLG